MALDATYYSTTEVAARFSVTVDTVRRWIREKDLEAVQINGRWRVSDNALERFANRKFERLQKTRHNS